MLMPTLMSMPMPRCRCRDFRMAGKDIVLSFCHHLNFYEIYGKHILNICKYIKYIKCLFTLYVKCMTANFKAWFYFWEGNTSSWYFQFLTRLTRIKSTLRDHITQRYVILHLQNFEKSSIHCTFFNIYIYLHEVIIVIRNGKKYFRFFPSVSYDYEVIN